MYYVHYRIGLTADLLAFDLLMIRHRKTFKDVMSEVRKQTSATAGREVRGGPMLTVESRARFGQTKSAGKWPRR